MEEISSYWVERIYESQHVNEVKWQKMRERERSLLITSTARLICRVQSRFKFVIPLGNTNASNDDHLLRGCITNGNYTTVGPRVFCPFFSASFRCTPSGSSIFAWPATRSKRRLTKKNQRLLSRWEEKSFPRRSAHAVKILFRSFITHLHTRIVTRSKTNRESYYQTGETIPSIRRKNTTIIT